MFWVTKQILKAYREEGFVGIEIFGPQGYGKTTYALKILKQVYKELGYKNDWDMALNMTFFDVEDFIPVLVKARLENKRIPAVLFDDAGIWLEKYIWYKENIRGFVKLYKMIRTFVSGVIFTTPSPEDIVKNIREKAWYQIKVVRHGYDPNGNRKGLALLYVYEVRKVKDTLKGVVREKAIDQFTVRLPDDVYHKYQKLRVEKGIDPQLKTLLEAFPNAKKKLEEMGINVEEIEDTESTSLHNNALQD